MYRIFNKGNVCGWIFASIEINIFLIKGRFCVMVIKAEHESTPWIASYFPDILLNRAVQLIEF